MKGTPLPRRVQRRGHRHGDGQIVITFAITMALYLFGMIAMVINLSALYAARAAVSQAAQDGAVAGASDVNLGEFLSSGTVALNGGATAQCSSTATGDLKYKSFVKTVNAPSCPINGNGYEITATVSVVVQLPVPLPGFSTSTVAGASTAAAQAGTDTPSGN